MTKVAVIGTEGRIPFSYRRSTKKLFADVGLNTGNLVFQHAMTAHISDEKRYYGWNVDPHYLRANYDLLVFPAANQLYARWDMGHLASLFEKSQLPMIVVGLGAQAQSVNEAMEMKPGTLRFMKIISERCTDIGVRGEFTASVLEKHGVKNIKITGCPSNFINKRAGLGRHMASKLSCIGETRRVLINVDPNAKLAQQLPRIRAFSDRFFSRFVCQDPEFYVRCGREIRMLEEDMAKINNLFFHPDEDGKALDFAIEKLVTFFDACAWLEYARRFDLSIGTKLHGNLLAWQAEVPAILLPHDARVGELVNTMKLPFVPLSKIGADLSLRSLKDNLNYDPASYDMARAMLGTNLLDILRESGVKPDPELVRFVDEVSHG